MKTILCYGDSNTYGWSPKDNARYGLDVRWGGVLRTTLGDDYWVIEEGLGQRTTSFPDPIAGEHRSGKYYLPACLQSHQPIDLIALMLGTNDLAHQFGLSAFDIALGAGALVDLILKSASGPSGPPKVLLMCPPALGNLSPLFAEYMAGGLEKSRQLARYYEEQARQYGCEFMDAGQVIVSGEVDGVHFDASDHQKLGKAVAARVNEILADIPG